MSKTESQVTPRKADQVVRHETNQAYNPVVSTEEVAMELEVTVEEAEELLEEAPRPQKKPVSDTFVWW